MLVRNLLLVVLSLSSFGSSFGAPGNGNGYPPWWDPTAEDDLLKCPGKKYEDKFYDIDVDVSYLPETCTPEQLVVIGWLIEDAIQDMEEHQPEYEVSWVICSRENSVFNRLPSVTIIRALLSLPGRKVGDFPMSCTRVS